MADWFVDSSAVGTNSGDSVANAAIDINSLTFGGTVDWGDRVWVRRTMSWEAQSFICGRSGFNPRSHAPIEIIGWPSSGDPYYLERPSAAAWDADGALYAGMPWPVLVTSGVTNQPQPTLREGGYITNFLMTSSTALSRWTNFSAFGSLHSQARRAGKLAFLNLQIRDSSDQYFDEVIYCGSGTAANMGFSGCARKFTISRSYVGEAPLFNRFSLFGEIINESSSIDHIMVSSILTPFHNPSFIGHLSGERHNAIAPFRGVNAQMWKTPILVGNYYGEGPARFGLTAGGIDMRVAAQSTAVYSQALATHIEAGSSVVTVTDIDDYVLHNGGDHLEFIGQPISVLSGTRVTATMFFYITGGIASLDQNRNGWMHLTGPGGGRFPISARTSSSGIYPGCADLWTGNSVAVGSAYIGRHSWVPTDSTTAFLFACPPFPTTMALPQSCQVYLAPFFEVSTG